MLRVATALVALAFLSGCGRNGVRADSESSVVLDGPPLETVVQRVQQAMDRILIAPEWQSFAAESEHWSAACRQASESLNDTCVFAQDAAYAACEASGTGVVAEERCRRIFAGDRAICAGNGRPAAVRTWCNLSAPESVCEQQKKSIKVACSAANAVPRLALIGAKIVVNVAAQKSTEGSASLFVINFGKSSTTKRSTKIEMNLQLRPSRASYESPGGSSWSPRAEVESQAKGESSVVSNDVEKIIETVSKALGATAGRFEYKPGSKKIVPLRPKTFSFTFDFSISGSKKGGFAIDLAPTPIKLGASSGSDNGTGNQIVFEFGPEP